MSRKIDEIRRGLENAFSHLRPSSPSEKGTGRGGWRSDARLEVLAYEVLKYMPDLAKALGRSGRLRMKVGKRNQKASEFIPPVDPPRGAHAMIGFAVQGRAPRRTDEWMRELREAEAD